MKKHFFWLALFGTVGFLTGCYTITPLQPNAANVKIVKTDVPISCQKLGAVEAHDINGVTQVYTSHKRLIANEVNSMKNSAYKLGANVIVLTGHQVDYVSRENYRRVTTHVMTGDAYRCSPGVTARLTPASLQNLLDTNHSLSK